ncbi:MAG: alpha/beta hydrolase-fold protein [Oenococcus oeni]
MGMIQINMYSKNLSCFTDITLITPIENSLFNSQEIYKSDHKYKILWLLHGGNFDKNVWVNYTNLSRYIKDRDVIVVCPNGLNSDFANQPYFADGYNFADFYFDELMPYIYYFFPISRDPKNNFLAGYSMGAAACWMYGLQHPELFGGIAPLGSLPKNYSYLRPYSNLTNYEFQKTVSQNPSKFPSGYGKKDSGIHIKEINMISKYNSVTDFLNSPEHTYDRLDEALKKGNIPPVYLASDIGESNYKDIFEFKEYVEKADRKIIIKFDFSNKNKNGYDFCDYVLPRMLNFFEV